MLTPRIIGMVCAGMLLTSATLAHGGIYRGPGDIVPPGTGGHDPRNPGSLTPGQTGPKTPRIPGAPTPIPPGATGGSRPPGVPGTGPGRTGGITITEDLGQWQFWWEFNKDPFINLREAVHRAPRITGSDEFYLGATRTPPSQDSLKPSDSDIHDRVLPTLYRALQNSDNQDIVSACVMALAKIGRDGEKFRILPIFEKTLKRSNQEMRETAALGLGITAMPQALPDLIALATDSRLGRQLVARSEVSVRTRSFACYGLGLLAYNNADLHLKAKTLETLSRILKSQDLDRNIRVAVIHGISLLNLDVTDSSPETRAVLAKALSSLDAFYGTAAGRGTDLIKSHVPTSIAKLLGRGDSPLHRRYKAHYESQLKSSHKERLGADIYRACALALGQLATPEDKGISRTLLWFTTHGRDHQARTFALLALGQIGGDKNRSELMKALRKGNKALVRPWAAMALGVMEFHRLAQGKDSADVEIGNLLRKQLATVRNPASRGAFAVALGLARQQAASSELLDLLRKYRHADEMAGYLCLGLSLMDEHRAKEPIHEVVRRAVRRPVLLRQAAIALGRLGDKNVAITLTNMLGDKESNLAKLSALATALGFIGDRRSIAPLQKMLHDDSISPLSRAFAAVALGSIADKEKLPWNSKLARNINYRGAVETLAQSGTGVLEIL